MSNVEISVFLNSLEHNLNIILTDIGVIIAIVKQCVVFLLKDMTV